MPVGEKSTNRRIRTLSLTITIFLLFTSWSGKHGLLAQDFRWQGQLSGWATGNPERSLISQTGMRYLPEIFIEKPLSDNYFLDADIALNIFSAADLEDWQKQDSRSDIDAYRLWGRLATTQSEVRIGLQKINFGSATLFRPLQWFDRIDPRDPLKLTTGVYGGLYRYYFQNNANIWIWGLYGNDEIRGQDVAPTARETSEFGGRLQLPLGNGEAGLSYHYRRADFSQLPGGLMIPENRLGFDGKWDAGIGIWIEAVITRHKIDIEGLNYQRALTLGADYTFAVGNGLNIIAEHFRAEFSDALFSTGQGSDFSGALANYPVALVDNLSAIIYYDWQNKNWFQTLTWQRSYDHWLIFLSGFLNPEELLPNQNREGSSNFAGNGFQLMIVFNH